MDVQGAREFIREHHRGVLATRAPGGAIRQSPIVAAVDDDGRRIVISSRETAYRRRFADAAGMDRAAYLGRMDPSAGC